MNWEKFASLTTQERAQSFLAGYDAATSRELEGRVSQFKRYVSDHRKLTTRYPFEIVFDSAEVQELIRLFKEFRAAETNDWARTPVYEGYDAELFRKHGIQPGFLHALASTESQFAGERFLELLRKYWLLVFGYSTGERGNTKVSGIGQLIFEANQLDELDALLCLGNFKGQTLKEVASSKELRKVASRLQRGETHGPYDTIRNRVRNWGSPRRK